MRGVHCDCAARPLLTARAAAAVREIDEWGIILNVLHVINLIVMISLFFTGVEFCHSCWKRFRKKIDLTPSPGDEVASCRVRCGEVVNSSLWRVPAQRKPLFFDDANLNLVRERKVRIWHEFWDALFMTNETFKPPEDQVR